MKHLSMLAFLACVLLAGCAPANITSAKWDSGVSGDNAQVRCEQVDMRNKAEMDKVFPKYDGWKLVYISEYTTGNRVGTDAAVCFERANHFKSLPELNARQGFFERDDLNACSPG